MPDVRNREEALMLPDYKQRTESLLEFFRQLPELRDHVDFSLPSPQPWLGSKAIRLIILGQDPTVKSSSSRMKIRVVLNMDRPTGSLFRYLDNITRQLGVSLATEVYVTNAVNCFFKQPPARTREILAMAFGHWKALLNDELALYPGVPVVALGQPVLQLISSASRRPMVCEFWDYPNAVPGRFRYFSPTHNHLLRPVFPFPHGSGMAKTFYKTNQAPYCGYISRLLASAA